MATLIEKGKTLTPEQIQDVANVLHYTLINSSEIHIPYIKYARVGEKVGLGQDMSHSEVLETAHISPINVYELTRHPDLRWGVSDAGSVAVGETGIILHNRSGKLEVVDDTGAWVTPPIEDYIRRDNLGFTKQQIQQVLILRNQEYERALERLRLETCFILAPVFTAAINQLMETQPAAFTPPVTLFWKIEGGSRNAYQTLKV